VDLISPSKVKRNRSDVAELAQRVDNSVWYIKQTGFCFTDNHIRCFGFIGKKPISSEADIPFRIEAESLHPFVPSSLRITASAMP
jgi:hypothetical protein